MPRLILHPYSTHPHYTVAFEFPEAPLALPFATLSHWLFSFPALLRTLLPASLQARLLRCPAFDR